MKKKSILVGTMAAAALVATSLTSCSNVGDGDDVRDGATSDTEEGTDGKAAESKCGEGKCGEGKCGEGKCGEGKCGEEGHEDAHAEGMDSDSTKTSEGKCGEGKCGEGKCGEEH